MFTCEYDDHQPEALESHPEHVPLQVDIVQQSYGWSQQRDFYIYRFEVTHAGAEAYQDAYLGLFMDPDVGSQPEDDEFDHQVFRVNRRTLPIAYAHDAVGEVPGCVGSLILGFGRSGETPGVRRPAWHAVSHFASAYAFPDGDPVNDAQRYASMEESLGSIYGPADMRYVVSVGPFPRFEAGETLWFDVAFVIGHGLEGMLDAAWRAWRLYANDLVEARDSDLARAPAAAEWAGRQAVGGAPVGGLRVWGHPASPPLRIQYRLPELRTVHLNLYDPAGRRVRRLLQGAEQPAGMHSVVWDGADARGRRLPPGVYLYRLRAGADDLAGRLMLLR
ncbi:MAG: hypothetical protein GF330_09470 [Candidatus Eisenbacteria bacterium]|nr:hypothetical protein [Candidatus Eisenbacteria bacterium]